MNKKLVAISDLLEQVLAIELLECHNRNYLSAPLATSPRRASIEKRELLRHAIRQLKETD